MDEKKQNKVFVELLTPDYYKIHSFILSLVPNRTDAEDILQASITYMWEHFNDFKQGTSFLSWAFTISKFQVLTHRKKKQRSIVHFSEEALELIESENRKMSHEIDIRLEMLNKCMKKLHHKDQTFIKERFEKKKSVLSLAKEFEMSVNVAYKRLAHIKTILLICIHKAMDSRGEVS